MSSNQIVAALAYRFTPRFNRELLKEELVKKELMGRYSLHHWPDDPRAAEPTARAKKRRR